MRLSIARDLSIFKAQDKGVVGCLPMIEGIVPLKAIDLVLIYLFQSGDYTADTVCLNRERFGILGGHKIPASSYIKARIKYLQENGIIVDESMVNRGAETSAEVMPLQAATTGKSTTSKRTNSRLMKYFELIKLKWSIQNKSLTTALSLRPCKNFMLTPVASGFSVWSPASRCNHVLSLDVALVLIAFVDGKHVSKVLDDFKEMDSRISLAGSIGWLYKQGLLVNLNTEAARKEQEVLKIEKQRIVHAGDPGSWQGLELNGRIPIYFFDIIDRHLPLALGMLRSHIQQYKNGLLLKDYMPVPIVSMTEQEFIDGPYKTYGPGVWLFSNYMWSVNTNLEISKIVKDESRNNLMIHGGPSSPNYAKACKRFLDENSHVDIVVHGEGEYAIVEILEKLEGSLRNLDAVHDVSGLTIRGTSGKKNSYIKTKERIRMKELDAIPSPYLDGSFDVYGGANAAIIESNRGCPFRCTFCDWGSATAQKVRKFDMQRVKDEIEWIGKQKIRVLWVADANFGMYDRDIELSEWICSVKKKYGYPKEVVVNYTKNATERLADIVKVFAENDICGQGIISIQTRDEATLDVIQRRNIKSNKYDDLAEIFQVEGLPLSTDLMLGLPGITVEGFKNDLQYFDKDIEIKAYPTQLLPNSPMADPEYIKAYKIKFDDLGYLTSSFSYTDDELRDMENLYHLFKLADSYSLLRYPLRYLQWDHGIKALDFLQLLLHTITADKGRYPTIRYAFNNFEKDRLMPGGWCRFYDEIARFTEDTFSISRESAFNAVLRFNESVMPDDGIMYPVTIHNEHDVISYFRSNLAGPESELKPLADYPAAVVEVEDKYFFASIDSNSLQYDTHQTFWELITVVSRRRSTPNIY